MTFARPKYRVPSINLIGGQVIYKKSPKDGGCHASAPPLEFKKITTEKRKKSATYKYQKIILMLVFLPEYSRTTSNDSLKQLKHRFVSKRSVCPPSPTPHQKRSWWGSLLLMNVRYHLTTEITLRHQAFQICWEVLFPNSFASFCIIRWSVSRFVKGQATGKG